MDTTVKFWYFANKSEGILSSSIDNFSARAEHKNKTRQDRGQCACDVISTMNRDTRGPGRGTFVVRLYAKDIIAESVFAHDGSKSSLYFLALFSSNFGQTDIHEKVYYNN